MGILGAFRKGCYSLIDTSRRIGIWKGEIKEIRKRKTQYEQVVLSKTEKSEIDDYFVRHYGKRYSDKWHRLYQSYTGIYRKNYFPEILFSTRVEPKTNPLSISEVFDDKNMVPILVSAAGGDVRCPVTLLARVNGSYVSDGKVIGSREAEARLKACGDIVIKKTAHSSSGRDVLFSGGGQQFQLPCLMSNSAVIGRFKLRCANRVSYRPFIQIPSTLSEW